MIAIALVSSGASGMRRLSKPAACVRPTKEGAVDDRERAEVWFERCTLAAYKRGERADQNALAAEFAAVRLPLEQRIAAMQHAIDAAASRLSSTLSASLLWRRCCGRREHSCRVNAGRSASASAPPCPALARRRSENEPQTLE